MMKGWLINSLRVVDLTIILKKYPEINIPLISYLPRP